MRARAVTDVQQSIRRHRSLRALTCGGVVGCSIGTVVDFAAVPGDFFAFPAAWTVLVAVIAALEWRTVGRLEAREARAETAERPKTLAESVAEAVEASRQRQWDAIAERAYLAKPPPAATTPIAPVIKGTSMADMAAGFARLSAALGPCAHPDAEPVDLITGERVAWVCPDCPAELPANWR